MDRRKFVHGAAGLLVPAGLLVGIQQTKASLINQSGPRFRASSSSSSSSSGGSGFAARPYFFQTDASRLAGYVSGAVSEWSGSASNTPGSPLGFATLMSAAYTEATTSGSSYNDIVTSTPGPTSRLWWIAIWAHLANNAAAKAWCADKVVAIVAANPTGAITNNEYQHIEDFMMNTAMIGDLLYSEFSAGELADLATYVNGVQADGDATDSSFWPFGSVQNNYNHNRLLSKVIAGICSEGWNSNASTLRAEAETILDSYVTTYNSPNYSGPQISEGSYYGNYMKHTIWAMRQYDAVMGTTYLSDITATPAKQLELFLYQMRGDLKYTMHLGSQANSVYGNYTNIFWDNMRTLSFLNSATTDGQLVKTIFAQSQLYDDGNNFEPRNYKAFSNFYWNLRDVSTVALTAKTDRRVSYPMPGPGMTFLRSADGWNNASTCRTAVMFHHKMNTSPAYSHANPDAPGFQWSNANNYIAVDPEYAGSSGIHDEAGTSVGNQFSNAVGCASAITREAGGNPTLTFDEDNTGDAVPHYYVAINAQPYWTNTTTCRRHYVWLDDMQVCVIWDRVVTAGADTKTWRLHVDSTSGGTSVASGVATCTVPGTSNITLKVYDLFATSGGAMSEANLIGTQTVTRNIYRISQTDAANDFISLKALGINGRLTAATLSTGTDGTGAYKQADLTINGVSRSVRFYDNGTSHAVVS